MWSHGIKPGCLVCHSHTRFGVAVLVLGMAMSFDHQHGRVEDSVTVTLGPGASHGSATVLNRTWIECTR